MKKFKRVPPAWTLSRITRDAVAIALLLIGLFITGVLWSGARDNVAAELQLELDSRTREVIARIEESLLSHKRALRSAVALLKVAPQTTRDEFHIFVDHLQMDQNFPGLRTIGFIPLVPGDRKAQFIALAPGLGLPAFAITPAGTRTQYAPVLYLEPPTRRHAESIGKDMLADERFRASMEEARDSGEAALTSKITFETETDRSAQPGFYLFLPVYTTPHPPETVQARRAHLAGWIYGAVQMSSLMQPLRGERSRHLYIEIHDGDQISDATQLFDNDPALTAQSFTGKLQRVDTIALGERKWVVVTSAMPAFGQYINDDRPTLILQAGVACNLLLAMLAWLFLDDRLRAYQAAVQAMRMALYDGLTGLPNRKLIQEHTKQALTRARRNGRRAAILFIDLDKFKPVNDTYGHAVGDALLKEVANRLQQCVRESDTVARLGGDEFVALLADLADSHGALRVAEKMRDCLSRPFKVEGHTVQIGGSIGGAIFPDDATDQEELLKRADAAMYEAKEAGRNTVRFSPSKLGVRSEP